jgi:hypothetical protein
MEKIGKLIVVLPALKKISNDIIRKTIPIMKSIELENNSYTKEVSKKFPELSTDLILEKMQRVTLDWVGDAEKVKSEIDRFIVETEDGVFKLDFEMCKFLAEVWNGDTYDKMEIDGLQALLDDLKTQLSEISQENLVPLTLNYVYSNL